MAVELQVVEIIGDNQRPRGSHRFIGLPSPGDRMVLAALDLGASLEMMRVLYVEHSPQRLDGMKASAMRDPSATVYVEHVPCEEDGFQ